MQGAPSVLFYVFAVKRKYVNIGFFILVVKNVVSLCVACNVN